MAPLEKTEEFDLESLEPLSIVNKNRVRIDENINVITREKERRITIYHYVVHILSFIIVIPFIVLIIYGKDIPEVYATIVSVVIGFYFAKSLFNNN